MLKPNRIKTEFGKHVFKKYFGVYFPERPVEQSKDEKPVAVIEPDGNAEVGFDKGDEAFTEPQAEAKPDPKSEEVFAEPEQPPTELPQPAPQSAHLPGTLEGKVSSIPLPVLSEPYARGDDVFSELITYFHANKIYGQESKPVLEEDANCLLATVAAASRLSLLIEGASRSGKSLIINKMCKLLTSTVTLNVCSNKALFDLADIVNQSDFLYITEYQAAIEDNPAMKEAVKRLSENEDATNDSNGQTKTIYGNVTILSTGADENKRTQKRDVEVSGRFIILKTRSDPEKTDIICKYLDGLADGTIKDIAYSKNRFDKLKNHIKDALDDRTTGFENPFAKYFGENHLPNTQKSVHYRNLYHSMINVFTKFDRHNRVKKENGKLLTSIADIYLVYTLYHKTYCNTLKRLSSQSFEAVEKTLSEVEKEERRKEYENEIAKVDAVMQKEINWQEIWNSAYSHMKQNNPPLADEWAKLQSKGEKVVVYDPILQRDIYLCDALKV